MGKNIANMFEKRNALYCAMQKVIEDKIFDELDGKAILITGGTGFIIRYFVYMILCRNDKFNSKIELNIMVRSLEKAKALYGDLINRPDINLICSDVCNSFKVEKPIDYIIHSAGQSNPSMIQKDPVGTFNANVIGTNNVLKYAKENNVKSILFMSSYMVYNGNVNKENVNEPYTVAIDFQNYKNCYAQSKRSGEMLCACYNEQYGLHTKIIRPSFVFGSSDEEDVRVWSEIIRKVARNEDVLLKSNGVCVRPVSYVIDVATAMLYVLLKGHDCIGYNIESEMTTIRQFAQIATKHSNGCSNLTFENERDRYIDENSLIIPDDKKYAELLPIGKLCWKPKWSLEEAIVNAIEVEKSI